MTTTISKTKTESDRIEAYWTKEKRDKARPKPLPVLPDHFEWEDDRHIPQTPIATPPNASVLDANIDQALVIGLATPVKDPAKYPWSCNGKLFFTWKGDDYVGSAGSILLEVLLTAGHNIFDQGEWSDNFLYYPAYPDLQKSYGWSRVAIFTAWQNDANYAFDYAMIMLDSTLPDEVGSMGVIRDLSPKDRSWTAIGYPAAAPYSGNQMYQTTGDYVTGSTIITMNNNDLTQGSSGGNWLTEISEESYVNGVQSNRNGQSDQANSPYIANSDYTKLLDCVTTGTCE